MTRSQKGGGWFSSNNDQSYTMENGMNSGVLQYVYYFIIVTIIIILLLVLIHFTIKPIFRFNPGDNGFIGIPGSDDSKLYWSTPSSILQIKDVDTPVGSLTENWSFALDINLDNPTANTDRPRVLFTRGQILTPSSTPFQDSDTILTINPAFNVCVYLDRLTNDLYVAVQTKTTSSELPTVETIVVPNIPVRKSLRLGCFVGSRVLEVYVNGYLVRSKAFPNSLRSVTGPMQPPLDPILNSTARVANLRIWPRPLTAAEFRSNGTSSNFDVKDVQDSCVT